MRYYSGSEARLRRAIENMLVSIFDGWSYEEITTPTIDYYSLFERGMGRSQAHHAFRFSDTDGRMLAIRPDVTSLVARAAATLFAERARPAFMRGKAHDAALGARLEFEIGRFVRHGWSPWFRPFVQSRRLAAIGEARKQQTLTAPHAGARRSMRPHGTNWINNLTSWRQTL